MNSRLDGMLEAIETAQDLDGLQRAIVSLRDHYQLSHMVYHWVAADGEQFGCGTYPLSWVQHYVSQDYLRIDPVIQACFQQASPVDWASLDWSGKQARVFLSEAIEAGIGGQGYSIPVRGPNGQFAIFSASGDDSPENWQLFTETHRRDLILLAHGFNQKALEIKAGRVPGPVRKLSGREADVLTYLAMGYSRAQVADLLSISEHTLRAYVESARLKLGSNNTIHAVSRAVAQGLIVVGGSKRAAKGDWPGRGQQAAAE